jgi:hypothetical protein
MIIMEPFVTPLNFPFSTILAILALLVVASYCIYTVIFYYHWIEYTVDGKTQNLTLGSYFLTTIPLALAILILTLIII